eukprot:TRINITY_DN48333_c0_g1_i2.p1 TRINITY_DN48333_c0_g1~~TRINITY_DN48333_c0_g1_i2.p1  ORF type:complete len:255 (-),score=21.46 TRINITY_DN48333_c0_g1_i2:45-809(-)
MATASELKNKGNECFKTQRYPQAVDFYSQAIRADPKNETLYSNRAASYSCMGKHEEALADAKQCVVLKPEWVKGHFRQGVALFNMKRFPEAVTAFEKALSLEQGNDDIQNRLNDARRAMKHEADNRHPGTVRDPMECKKIGNTQFKEGKYEDAIGWYTRAIELSEANPNSPDTAIFYCNRAACHAQNHAYKSVVSDCDSAIALDANFSKAYLRRAMAFESLEKWQKACNDYKRVMELDPGASTASQGYHRCVEA